MSSNKIEISVKDIPEIIKTLEEAEKEIEFERKSKNLFIDDLYKVCEISLKQDKEIERLNNIINEINSIVEYWGYDKEHNDISSFRMAMKNIKDILGSDKE